MEKLFNNKKNTVISNIKYLLILFVFSISFNSLAQETSYIKGNEYILKDVSVSGLKNFNEQTVITYTGLKEGQKIRIPGEQISAAMYGGDRSRKENLVEYGFRLPAAMDNRPLKFEEFEAIQNQTIYVSATPADYELQNTEGVFIEQIIRPTGLLDPKIEVRPSLHQIDDLIEEIQLRVEKDERTLVTTLTKRMAEELTKYLSRISIRCRYIHSDVDTLERVEIMQDLRKGIFDVLIGVNLLREGLDLPEVSLVAILDADKEGFLRSHRSLTQTIGRAARNVSGIAIMYADKITKSMQLTIDETNKRREKQISYNKKNKITPTQINKKIDETLSRKAVDSYQYNNAIKEVAKQDLQYLAKSEIEKRIREKRKQMEEAAKSLDFIVAAQLRDEITVLKEQLQKK